MSNDVNAAPAAAAGPDLQAVVMMIAARLGEGAPEPMIVSEAVGMGMDPQQAQALYNMVTASVRQRTLTPGAIVGAVAAGGVTALICAAAWVALVVYAHREAGLAAWGIGLLVGLAVRVGSGGRRGENLAVIAGICALLGVGLAKAVMFAFIYLADPDHASLAAVLSFYDILWVILAGGTAWRMLRPPSAAGK